MALKSETMSLAISLELPLLLVDIQRGGPSTGLPTKTEAADLLIALYGRHAEAPLPVVAAFSPSHCFFAAIEAARLALKYRTPVILLSDGYLANGAEPWRLPDVADLPDISVPFATETNHVDDDGTTEFWPYLRDPETLARPWAIPGTPGLQHRVGGLEKEDGTGNIDYTPENHSKMVRLRAAKVAGIANDIPAATVQGDEDAELLIVGWGSTWAAIDAAVQRFRRRGRKVAWTHLVHLNPLPANLGDIVRRYPKILMPELNLGQLSKVVRAEYLVDAKSLTKVEGLPFTATEIDAAIEEIVRVTDTAVPLTTKKDWTSDQEVRWCPGCGDYGILLAVQMLMPELGVKTEDVVFVSGIGCSSRFPYYMNTYGIHSIHGRAPAIATGVAVARPDLDVWVITGDGDGLSIGGNHLIHALRRNVNLTILLFNNQIYGLTKGQFSPTSELGKVTKSTPFGSVDMPFNPLSVALGAEATFVARTHDLDRKHMIETFRAAHAHKGAAFVEILQNCNVFNDGAFDAITGKEVRPDMLIPLDDGQPIRFGADLEKGVDDALRRPAGDRRGGRRRRGRHPRPRRPPAGPEPGLRPRPAGRQRPPADADRRVPRRRAPRVHHRGQPPAGGGLRAQGPGRHRVAAALERHLDRRVVEPVPGSDRERSEARTGLTPVAPRTERSTRPVLGFGAKKVDFGGMSSLSLAVASIWSTVTGRSSTP